MLTSKTGAPLNETELFTHYFQMVKSIVRKAGIDLQDVDDVASAILLRYMESGYYADARDAIEAGWVFDIGTDKPKIASSRYTLAKFASPLRQYAFLSVRNYLDKQRKRKANETAFPNVSDAEDQMGMDDLYRKTEVPVDDAYIESRPVEFSDRFCAVRDRVALLKARKSGSDQLLAKALEEALDAAVWLAEHDCRVTVKAVAERLGWSSQHTSRVLRELRS